MEHGVVLMNVMFFRLRSVDTSVEHASLYQNGLVGEQDWVDHMQARIESQAPLSGDVHQAKTLLEPSMVFITTNSFE